MIFTAGMFQHASAQLKVPGLDKFKEAMSNCSMSYSMKCTYPGGKVYDITGVMAVSGNRFYDSSNMRFVLQDAEWYIIADHLEKIISVTYIKDINNELDGMASITASTFLYNDDFFEGISKINTVKQTSDTSWLSLEFKDNNIVENLEVQLLRANMMPISYSAIVKFPMGGYEGGESGIMKLEVRCYNIITPASRSLFDTGRLISMNGRTATLKKYKTYKTYK